MPYPLATVQIAGRDCGGCTACCVAVGVHELSKPPWTPCPNLSAAGCGCYDVRPESCRTFACLWLSGDLAGDLRRRPDNLGVMFLAGRSAHRSVDCWEIRPGALDDPAVQYILDVLSRKHLVHLRYHNNARRRVMGPAHLLDGAEIVEIG